METRNRLSSITETIGDTPLVQLPLANPSRKLYLKLEKFNPGQSMKDRMALNMIEAAEQAGRIEPGDTIIESSSGNTGTALAMICASRGYKFVAVVDHHASQEKIDIMRAYGADVIFADDGKCGGHIAIVARENLAEQLSHTIPNAFYARQCANPANPTGYTKLAAEILDAVPDLTFVIGAVGTGGSLCGTATELKRLQSHIAAIGVEPVGSIIFGGVGEHYYQSGSGNPADAEISANIDYDVIDEGFKVSDREAFNTARFVARRFGILVGGSAGGVLYIALQRISTAICEPTTGVAILADAGDQTISLVWDATSHAYSYTVLRATSPGGPYLPVQTGSELTDTTFVDTGLVNGTAYYYVVSATNSAGTSTYSPEVSATPASTRLTEAQAIQIATTFCTAIGQPQITQATAHFPAERLYATQVSTYYSARWRVQFGDPVSATVDVADATGTVTLFINDALLQPTLDYAGTPISQAAAVSQADLVLSSSGSSDTIGSAIAEEVSIGDSTEQYGHEWSITYPRQNGTATYMDESANVFLQAETGAVLSFGLAFPSPPISGDYTVLADQATSTASAQMSAAGILNATYLTTSQEVVKPNNYWVSGDPSPLQTSPRLGWTVYYGVGTAPDTTVYAVYIGGTSNTVIGGYEYIERGVKPANRKLDTKRTLALRQGAGAGATPNLPTTKKKLSGRRRNTPGPRKSRHTERKDSL